MLSERLSVIAGYIEQGDRVADIGSDHGLLPFELIKSGRAKYVIVTDLNDGPLARARFTFETGRMGIFGSDNLDKFYLRKSDGLAEISPGEVDTCVIAGMGGKLIYNILARYAEVTKSIKKFILQPRTKATELRQGLGMLGLKIVAEDLARERRKISEIIVCEQGEIAGQARNDAGEMHELCHCGSRFAISKQLELLFETKNPLLPEYLQMKIAQKEKEFRGNKNESTKDILLLYKDCLRVMQ